MPPKSRKRKATPVTEVAQEKNGTITVPDRASWQGWVEMESEPAFFNVMLKEMGVRGVKIQEVYGLEDESLAILPQPVHALIFLFRYRETDKDQLGTECPEHVWYAEQVPDFACASVALLNIVNNIPGLEMGKELLDFKAFTQDMDPHSRGDAIDDFIFVKRIHNSFASDNDMLIADMCYKEKLAAANKRQAVAKAKKTRAANAAAKAAAAKAAAKDVEETDDESDEPREVTESKSSPAVKTTASPAPVPSIEAKASPAPDVKPRPKKATPVPAASSALKERAPATRSSGRQTRATLKAAATASASPTPATKQSPRPKAARKPKAKPEKLTNGTAKVAKQFNGTAAKATSVIPDSDSELTELDSSPAPIPKKATKQTLKTGANKPKLDPNGDFNSTTKTEPTPQARRSGRQPQPRKGLVPLDGSDDRDTPKRASRGKAAAVDEAEVEDEGFHFCAYMPIGDHVWKLDGMDRFPQDMGAIDTAAGQDWLSIAQPELQSRMMQYADGAIEFNLMSLVHDPLVANVEALSTNIKALQEIEAKLTAVVDDWTEMDGTEVSKDVILGISTEFGVTQVDLDKAKISERTQKQLDAATGDLLALIDMRKEAVTQQGGLRAACRDELESGGRDAEHAQHRRHDYQGMVKEWFGALAEQEQLSALVGDL